MFNKKLFLAFIILLSIHFHTLHADDRVKITLHQPPPNQLSVSDVWKMTLENLTDSTLNIYLVGSVDKDNSRVVEGTSAGITLPPGKSNYNYRSFETGSVNWYDNTLKEFILRTGNVPAGNYVTCIQAFSSNNNAPLSTQTCIDIPIVRGPTTEITLITPADEEVLEYGVDVVSFWPVFAWSSPVSKGPYNIVIKEMKEGQTREQAMKENKDFFNKKNIKTASYQYGTADPKLEEGKNYVWIIETGDIKSEVLVFRISKEEKAEITKNIIDQDTAKKENEQIIVNLISPGIILKDGDTRPTFQWSASNPKAVFSYSIKVVELNEDKDLKETFEKNPPIFEQSNIKETSFAYPSSMQSIDSGKFYLWSVTAYEANGIQVGKSMIGGFKLPMQPPPLCTYAFNSVSPITLNVCQGGTATLAFVVNSPGSIYAVVDPNNNLASSLLITNSTSGNITFIAATPGTYTLVGIKFFTLPPPCSWLGCLGICANSITVIVNILPLPTAPNITGTDHVLSCNGTITLSTTDPPLPAGYSYQWQRSASCNGTYLNITGATNSTRTVALPGCYRLVVINTTTQCSSPSADWNVTDPSPVPSITGTSHNICNQSPLIPITLTTNGIGVLQWFRNGILIPAATTSTLTVTSPGIYYVTSTIPGCTTQSANWVVNGFQCDCIKCKFNFLNITIIQNGTTSSGLPRYQVKFKINNTSGTSCPANFTMSTLGPAGNVLLNSPPLPNFAPSGISPVPALQFHTFNFSSTSAPGTHVFFEFMFTLLNGITNANNGCKLKLEVVIPN